MILLSLSPLWIRFCLLIFYQIFSNIWKKISFGLIWHPARLFASHKKSQNWFYFNFYTTKLSDLVSNLNDDCSQLFFEVYNICVAQKLWISEFLINFLSLGTWPLRGPPEATISTSATSIGYQILAKYLSFYMRLCLLL